MGQESGHNLAGSFIQVLQKLQAWSWPDLCSPLGIGVVFLAHLVVGRIQFCVTVGLWLSAPRGHLQFPVTWLSPQTVHIPGTCFFKVSGRVSLVHASNIDR